MIIYIRIRPAVRGYRQILLARVHIYKLDNLDTFTAKCSRFRIQGYRLPFGTGGNHGPGRVCAKVGGWLIP